LFLIRGEFGWTTGDSLPEPSGPDPASKLNLFALPSTGDSNAGSHEGLDARAMRLSLLPGAPQRGDPCAGGPVDETPGVLANHRLVRALGLVSRLLEVLRVVLDDLGGDVFSGKKLLRPPFGGRGGRAERHGGAAPVGDQVRSGWDTRRTTGRRVQVGLVA